jgi:hypothetical protein
MKERNHRKSVRRAGLRFRSQNLYELNTARRNVKLSFTSFVSRRRKREYERKDKGRSKKR